MILLHDSLVTQECKSLQICIAVTKQRKEHSLIAIIVIVIIMNISKITTITTTNNPSVYGQQFARLQRLEKEFEGIQMQAMSLKVFEARLAAEGSAGVQTAQYVVVSGIEVAHQNSGSCGHSSLLKNINT